MLAGQFGTILHLRALVIIPIIKAEWEYHLYKTAEPSKEERVASDVKRFLGLRLLSN